MLLKKILLNANFNPRSLTGATTACNLVANVNAISIHAPSRERLKLMLVVVLVTLFQSTLPHGSDT